MAKSKRKEENKAGSSKKFKVNIETLIAEVLNRPLLWLETSKDYKNTAVTDKLWDEVGVKTEIPGIKYLHSFCSA